MQENNFTVRVGVAALALLGLVTGLYFGRALFLPLVISLMLASVFWPIVQHLHQRWHLPRVLAGALVIVGFVALIISFALWALTAIQQLVQDLPQTYEQQVRVYEVIRKNVQAISPEFAEHILPPRVEDSVFFQHFDELVRTETRNLPVYLRLATENIILVLFLVFFLLLEGDMLIRRFGEIFGPITEPNARAAIEALQEMALAVRSYIVWRTLINVAMAIFLGIFFTHLGLKQGWTWAILAGILTFVPYIGPIIAGVPPLVEAFVAQGFGPAVTVAVVYTLVSVVEGYVIFPLVIGRNVQLNATTVLLACLFWYVVWGEVGLFLAVPLMAGVRAICLHVPGWEAWGNLMGMEPSTPGWIRRLVARWFPSWQALHGLTPNPSEASVHLAGPGGEDSPSSVPTTEQNPIAVTSASWAKSGKLADSA
ncbi:MAG: AI-2E family transporter [Gemmatales bacterium]|nr:AI-2E family transporter [Gemmatales bacterium]MDW7993633.1 AI-2E family transporter [Gemmatales bacterium]